MKYIKEVLKRILEFIRLIILAFIIYASIRVLLNINKSIYPRDLVTNFEKYEKYFSDVVRVMEENNLYNASIKSNLIGYTVILNNVETKENEKIFIDLYKNVSIGNIMKNDEEVDFIIDVGGCSLYYKYNEGTENEYLKKIKGDWSYFMKPNRITAPDKYFDQLP